MRMLVICGMILSVGYSASLAEKETIPQVAVVTVE